MANLVQEDLSVTSLRDAIANGSGGVQAAAKLAIACQRSGNSSCGATDVIPAIDAWKTNTRVQGRTAYIAAAEGSPYPAGECVECVVRVDGVESVERVLGNGSHPGCSVGRSSVSKATVHVLSFVHNA